MTKRTITKNHLARLELQKEEASTLKLVKVADSLSEQITKQGNTTRTDDAMYIYSAADLQRDINSALWAAAIRVADYLGTVPDARNVQQTVDKLGRALFEEMCVYTNVPDGVGAYEPTVPGEARTYVSIEVEEPNE